MRSVKIYGDSILKGVMYNEELNKYKLFGYKYDDLAENGIEVENNCKMGATVNKGLDIIKATLDDCGGDTAVVLEFGGNDCNFDWAKVSDDPEGDYRPLTPEDEFVEKYIEAVDYARGKGAEVAVCTLVPIESQRFMNWVSRGLNYDNIMRYLGDVNMIARWQEYYSRLAEKVARLTESKVLDLRSAFLKPKTLDRMICVDGIHPNAEGHKRISQIFQKSVIAALA